MVYSYQLSQLTLSESSQWKWKNYYIMLFMWDCEMTVFPLSAPLRFELTANDVIMITNDHSTLGNEIFHESICRYGRSSPRTG